MCIRDEFLGSLFMANFCRRFFLITALALFASNPRSAYSEVYLDGILRREAFVSHVDDNGLVHFDANGIKFGDSVIYKARMWSLSIRSDDLARIVSGHKVLCRLMYEGADAHVLSCTVYGVQEIGYIGDRSVADIAEYLGVGSSVCSQDDVNAIMHGKIGSNGVACKVK